MTTHTSTKGRYTGHHMLPYVLTPRYADHDDLGFRGRACVQPKPAGILRIVCVGASSTYGLFVDAHETHAARLEELLRRDGVRCEVLNAGVPGWISLDTLVNFQTRILPLDPDVIVVYQGRNELFPQSFNNYSPDYSHFRRADYSVYHANYAHKFLFRSSHLLMALSTFRGSRLGWSDRQENPTYGRIRYDNQPTWRELIDNLEDEGRTGAFKRNVKSLVGVCRIYDIEVVLCTTAFRPELLRTGVLRNDPRIWEALQRQVGRNNDCLRRIAEEHDVLLVETAELAETAEFFVDDCHCTAEGHLQRAKMIRDAMLERGISDKPAASRIDREQARRLSVLP